MNFYTLFTLLWDYMKTATTPINTPPPFPQHSITPHHCHLTDTVKFIQILNEQSDPTVIELLILGVLDWSCTRSYTFCFDIRAVFLRAVVTQFKYQLAYCVFQSYLAPVVSQCFLIEPEITFMTRNA